jgi:hypothetical protein
MYHKTEDYITRLLRPLGMMLAQILSLRSASKTDEALMTIDHTAQQLLGMNAGLLHYLPYDTLLDMLDTSTTYGAIQGLILGDLLHEEGEIYTMAGEYEVAHDRTLKAFQVYYELTTVRDTADLREDFPDDEWQIRMDRIADCAAKLHPQDIPEAVALKLMWYYEDTGAFAKAEDVLFDILDSTADADFADSNLDELFESGLAFFRRLQFKTDDVLEVGNLPRSEVEAGLEELREMIAEYTHYDEEEL